MESDGRGTVKGDGKVQALWGEAMRRQKMKKMEDH